MLLPGRVGTGLSDCTSATEEPVHAVFIFNNTAPLLRSELKSDLFLSRIFATLPDYSEKRVNTSPPLLWQYDTTLHLQDMATGAKGLNVPPRVVQETCANA